MRHGRGEGREGRRFEQQAQVQLQPEGFAQAGDHLGRGDGVAAQQEKVIVARHLGQLQLFAPDRRDLLLHVRFQRHFARRPLLPGELRVAVEAAIGLPKRTGRTLHFAAGGLRQGAGVEQHHHARGLLAGLGHGLADRLDQRFGRQDFLHAAADFRGNADALQALVIDRKCGDPALAHRFHFALDGLFDVLGVEVMTAHDQQVFQAPGDIHLAVADEAQVTSAQPGAAGVLDEGLGAGFRVAPVAVGDARAGGPEFADALVGQLGEGVRVGDQHGVVRLAGAATHDRRALPRFGTVGGQRLLVHAQGGNATATGAAGDKQGGFGEAVGREEIIRGEATGGEFFREAFQGVETDRFGTRISHAPAGSSRGAPGPTH